MKLSDPERYALQTRPMTDTIYFTPEHRRAGFSGLASTKLLPKLYVMSISSLPVFIGVTTGKVRDCLRRRTTENDLWRFRMGAATVDVWADLDGKNVNDLETVGAELVFLMRQAGQWPVYQSLLRFNPSNQEHRSAADAISKRYALYHDREVTKG